MFHWRKVSYFKFTYIFALVLLFISKFPIHNLKLGRWFLLTLKHLTLAKSAIIDFVQKIWSSHSYFKNLVNSVVLEECLNKTEIEKLGSKFWAAYQCILNVPLWNDWRKVTYSQMHGCPVLKALSLESLSWISATAFAEIVLFE